MKMNTECKEQWYLSVLEEINAFCRHLDEKIEKEHQELKACKKQNELETKLTQEMKLNNELNQRLTELSRRGNELDRVCTTFESCLTISDSDRNRLDNAKDAYRVAKELTGIRLDFSAPPNMAKGYVKSESRKLLQSFEVDMTAGTDSGALWDVIRQTAAPGWPVTTTEKDNRPNN